MKSLNDKLIEKAEKECTQLYYTEMQKIISGFMATFHLDEEMMRKTPALEVLWGLQYSSYGGKEILNEIIPNYTDNYIDSFINKAKEMQDMLEELNN